MFVLKYDDASVFGLFTLGNRNFYLIVLFKSISNRFLGFLTNIQYKACFVIFKLFYLKWLIFNTTKPTHSSQLFAMCFLVFFPTYINFEGVIYGLYCVMKIKQSHKLMFPQICTPVCPVFKRLSCFQTDVYKSRSVTPIVANNEIMMLSM